MCLVESLMGVDKQRTMAKQLQQIWSDQALEMAQLLRIHRQSYGLKHVPSQVADAVQTALRVLVYQLEHSYKVRQALTEFLRFGMALSKSSNQPPMPFMQSSYCDSVGP